MAGKWIYIYIWCEKVSICARIILYQMYDANVTLQTDLAQHDPSMPLLNTRNSMTFAKLTKIEKISKSP
jgi:hypothetical protein